MLPRSAQRRVEHRPDRLISAPAGRAWPAVYRKPGHIGEREKAHRERWDAAVNPLIKVKPGADVPDRVLVRAKADRLTQGNYTPPCNAIV